MSRVGLIECTQLCRRYEPNVMRGGEKSPRGCVRNEICITYLRILYIYVESEFRLSILITRDRDKNRRKERSRSSSSNLLELAERNRDHLLRLHGIINARTAEISRCFEPAKNCQLWKWRVRKRAAIFIEKFRQVVSRPSYTMNFIRFLNFQCLINVIKAS